MTSSDRLRKAAVLIFVYGGYTLVFAPVVLWLSNIAEPLATMGIAGWLIYAAAFVVLATIFVPSSLMKLVAGALFGFTGGLVAGGLGAFVGALVPFAIVRKARLRRHFEHQLEKPLWQAVDDAAEAHGLLLTVLLRLSLILPYNFSNYIWGATRITYRDYIIGNLFTFLPTILYAWWGAMLGDVAAIVAGGGPERDAIWWASMVASAALTIGGAFWMHRVTRTRLEEILGEQALQGSAGRFA